jgi:hypothetical protein
MSQDRCTRNEHRLLENDFLNCAFLAKLLGEISGTVVNTTIIVSHVKTRKIEAAKRAEFCRELTPSGPKVMPP